MRLFTITIDTEADCSADWTGSTPESYRNLTQMKERLLPLTAAFEAPATLLVNGDILQRDEPSRVCGELARTAEWELGTHLHGEFVAPERRYAGPAGIRLQDFQCGYAPDLERAKMKTLTELFRDRYGYQPTSFRAGRFGAGPTTFAACLELGYEVDSSVVPRALLEEGYAVADFRRFDHRPTLLLQGQGQGLVEIPVTVRPGIFLPPSLYLPRTEHMERRYSPGMRRFVARAKYGLDQITKPLHRTRWLRPSYSSAETMQGVLQWLARSDARQPVVANMMFHSNEVLAGASPYNATEADVDAFLDRMRFTLAAARDLGFTFCGLTRAARSVRGALS